MHLHYLLFLIIAVQSAVLILYLYRRHAAAGKKNQDDEQKASAKKCHTLFCDDKRALYVKNLNVIMESKPFLKKNYYIRDLSEQMDIPVHHLSYLINSEFRLHFQDYINDQRVAYLIANFDTPEWQYLTLEGMAWEAGFKSRSTFFRAFLKSTSQAPSEYFQNRKNRPYQV